VRLRADGPGGQVTGRAARGGGGTRPGGRLPRCWPASVANRMITTVFSGYAHKNGRDHGRSASGAPLNRDPDR
jgi:hypothetical protein